MNCKPGDLAIVVKSQCGNEGKIVRCIRVATHLECDRFNYWSGPVWHIDSEVLCQQYRNGVWVEVMMKFFPDGKLKPIRGQDGEDEMLRIAGYPHKETA